MGKTQVLGIERRRKFTESEKASLLMEAMETSITAVSEKHGIARAVLHSWKRKGSSRAFALVEVNEKADPTDTPQSHSLKIKPTTVCPDMIRVVVQRKFVVEFPLTVDPAGIAHFIKALEG